MGRLFQLALALTALVWSAAAAAEVRETFHSFDGSVLFGRYPHAFVSMEGELADGTPIKENYGFSAKSASPAVLAGPVEHPEVDQMFEQFENGRYRVRRSLTH